MEFSIGNLAFKVEIKYIGGDPSRMSKRAKRCLAERVLAKPCLAERVLAKLYYQDSKIDRIRALRQIAIDEGWSDKYNFGLKAAKDWVEEVFADNGAGEIAL